MVVAIQQHLAEFTAILTVCIVERCPPPYAVTIHKTCSDQQWNGIQGSANRSNGPRMRKVSTSLKVSNRSMIIFGQWLIKRGYITNKTGTTYPLSLWPVHHTTYHTYSCTSSQLLSYRTQYGNVPVCQNWSNLPRTWSKTQTNWTNSVQYAIPGNEYSEMCRTSEISINMLYCGLWCFQLPIED